MESEREKLTNYLDLFVDKQVAVVGDIMLDEYVYGDIERINPDSPSVPLLKVTGSSYVLGGAGNVAANVSALGAARVILFGLLGREKESAGKAEFLTLKNRFYNAALGEAARSAGVELVVEYEGETNVKQRLREQEHDGYLARSDWGEVDMHPISSTSKIRLFSELSQRKNLDAIILSDYNKRMFTSGFSVDIINFARRKSIPVFADPKPRNIAYYMNATMIRPNEKEAREMIGLFDKDVEAVARALCNQTKSKMVVVTCGRKGMLGYDGESYEVPTHARSVSDVTGAGDTVIAALALSILSGAALPEALAIANYAASVVVEKAGTATVTQEELRKRIQEF
ncbi:MAG: PfkB family carbohydrate kinase [Nanoarchaeota archaeon]